MQLSQLAFGVLSGEEEEMGAGKAGGCVLAALVLSQGGLTRRCAERRVETEAGDYARTSQR